MTRKIDGPRERSDDANAFIPDPGEGPAHAPEDLSDELAEQFLEAATTGQDADKQQLESTFPEEIGGPFVETTAAEEIAFDDDPMNPADAEREPLPRPVAGLVTDPTVEDHLDGAEASDETDDAAEPEPPDPEPGIDTLNETTLGGRRSG